MPGRCVVPALNYYAWAIVIRFGTIRCGGREQSAGLTRAKPAVSPRSSYELLIQPLARLDYLSLKPAEDTPPRPSNLRCSRRRGRRHTLCANRGGKGRRRRRCPPGGPDGPRRRPCWCPGGTRLEPLQPGGRDGVGSPLEVDAGRDDVALFQQ